MSRLFKQLVSVLTLEQKKIYVVESFTGGKFSSLITEIPGASKVFELGLVTYSNRTKLKELINSQLKKDIEVNGPTSMAVAIDMAKGLYNKVIEKNNSVYVSFTGNASPIDNGEICETFACVYIPQKNKTIEYHKNYVNVSRTRIILDACDSVAKIIIKETLKS